MCYPKGSGGSPQPFPGRDGVIWYVGSVSGWLSQWWLVCVPLEVGVTLGLEFEKTCSVSGKWNVSSVFPRLYGWVYKIFRFPLPPLMLELRVTIMGTHAQWVPTQGNSSSIPMGTQLLILVLWNLCSELKGSSPHLPVYFMQYFEHFKYIIADI